MKQMNLKSKFGHNGELAAAFADLVLQLTFYN